MKDIFFFILLLFASYCQTLELESLSSNILENDKNNTDHLPQFSWIDPSSIQVIYPDHVEDILHLRAADNVAEVVVRCLFSGNFEKEISGSFMVSGCMDDSYVYLTIYSSHLPESTSFIWEHSGVIEPVVSPYTILINETASSEKDNFEDDGGQNIARKRMKRGTFSYSDDSDDYPDYYDSDYDEDPEYSESSNSSEYYDYNEDEEEYYDLAFDGADGPPPPIPSDLILPMNLAYDEKLLKQMNRNHSLAQQYVIEVASHGSLHMKHSSLSTRIHLQFMGPPQFLSGRRLGIDKGGMRKLRKDKKNEAVPLIAFTKTDDSNKLMGVAFPGQLGGVCHQTKGTAILKWRSNPLVAAISFSHENGHMTGLRHDFKEDKKQLGTSNACEGTGIMSRGDNNPNRPAQWSECSAIRIRMWYPKHGQCLVPAPLCNGAERWSTPCTCGTGNDSVACLSSHAYCVENHFGETPNQCLSTNDLKALVMPQKGVLNEDEDSISSRLMMVVGILLKESQLLSDKQTSQINQQNGGVVSINETKLIDMENLQRQITNQGSRLENQVKDNQELRLTNLENGIKNQEKLITAQESRLANQEKLMKNQEILMKNQDKLISNQEQRLTNQENEMKNQEKLIENQELRLTNQEKLITAQESRLINQEKLMKHQDKLIVNQELRLTSQEELITNLTNQLDLERNNLEDSLNSEDLKDIINPEIEKRFNMLEKLNVLRTCHELEQSGVNISGYYNLDPDGDKVGHPPITAYCNFEDHVTEVLHGNDKHSDTIPHCKTNFCHTQEYTYSAHMDQITALMDLSTSCHQTIEYNCYGAPLSRGNQQLGVWVDRKGQDQIYFHGSNPDRHMCSCDSTNNCTGNLHCNCDASIPAWMEDTGKLTDMDSLPIMAFKYGPLMYETQQAKVRVGRLRCGGRKEVVGSIPRSCKDLKLLGETKPGLYHFQDDDHRDYSKMSYCQLDQPGYGENMESSSHWLKLISSPGQAMMSSRPSQAMLGSDYVQVFFVAENNLGIKSSTSITFNKIVVNKGGGMDGSTGIFTAPLTGIYDFTISGQNYWKGLCQIVVFLNSNSKFYMSNENSGSWSLSFTKKFVISLQSGDRVTLKKSHSDNIRSVQFYGILLKI